MLLMRKNGREIENVNCKMFNEQIFEIFHCPSLLPPTHYRVHQATNRSKAGKTIFKVPKMKNIFHSTTKSTRHFGAHATHASSNFPRSIDRRSLAASSARRCPPRVLMILSLLCNSPLICNANCAFSRKMSVDRSMETPERVSDP